ncbi:hypothetical protein [Labrenzia sp. PHM005]|uniref:hypothetical protein n=1 Tax=Labrenzia sp. PHM005 TaxID=2590016 RepID=UPI001FFC44A8|nr:hypothetical protein [Labrenzia sp. PHM005]
MPDLKVESTIAMPKISGVMSLDSTTLEIKRIPVVPPKEAIVHIAPVIAFFCVIATWAKPLETKYESPRQLDEMMRFL